MEEEVSLLAAADDIYSAVTQQHCCTLALQHSATHCNTRVVVDAGGGMGWLQLVGSIKL